MFSFQRILQIHVNIYPTTLCMLNTHYRIVCILSFLLFSTYTVNCSMYVGGLFTAWVIDSHCQEL